MSLIVAAGITEKFSEENNFSSSWWKSKVITNQISKDSQLFKYDFAMLRVAFFYYLSRFIHHYVSWCLCVYVYACVNVYMCICVCICVGFVHVYVYIYMCVCPSCIYIYTYLFMCVCLFIRNSDGWLYN